MKTRTITVLAAVSMTLFGCIEQGLLDGDSDALVKLNAAGKFRVMATHSSEHDQIASAKVLVNAIDVRSIDGTFFNYAIEPFVMDLMEFQNNAGAILARVLVPAGEYDLVRIHTAASGEAVLLNGKVLPLNVPSGEQTGIKLFFSPAVRVEQEKLSIGVGEFDLLKSFVVTGGAKGKVLFKPVLHVSASEPIVLPPAPVEDPAADPAQDPVVEDPIVQDPVDPVDPALDPTVDPLPGDSGDVFMPWIGV